MGLRFALYSMIFLLVLAALYCFKVNYGYSDLKNYLSALLTASSMVFTIMGIWIAFLYPNALRRLTNPEKIKNADFSETLGETKRLEGLVRSVLMSAIVVTAIMALYLLKTIFGAALNGTEPHLALKQSALAVSVVLGIIQIESIVYVVYSNIMFINELHQRREDREADADM